MNYKKFKRLWFKSLKVQRISLDFFLFNKLYYFVSLLLSNITMNYTTLPNTELKVSKICLGTMTFGNQNTESESHSQLDYAIEKGINFIDTAEMYPIGGNAQIFGSTERHIGTWIKKIGASERDKLVLATKIAGPNRVLSLFSRPLSRALFFRLNRRRSNPQTGLADHLHVEYSLRTARRP